MKYLKKFNQHSEYETYINEENSVFPNVSHCIDNNDVHYNLSKRNILKEKYLTFDILTDGTIEWGFHANGGVSSAARNANGKIIYYSDDNGENWNEISNKTSDISINVLTGDKLLFKGENNWYSVSSDYDYYNGFRGTADFNVSGNILSLFYGDNFKNYTEFPQPEENWYTAAFAMFYQASNVINAENLLLPSNTTPYCYSYMFAYCVNLEAAPELPATTLTEGCYNSMFMNCTSLTVAPELSATTLANICYSGMFGGCISLTIAPILPATNLESGCYSSMFKGCTGLISAPELPSTTLASSCYSAMFQNCTNLTTAPELSATTLTQSCYSQMFQGCTSLITAPTLSATQLANFCYQSMFTGCTNLVTAPELPAITLENSCYNNMFMGCSKLNYIKAMFTTTPSNTYTYNWVKNVASSGTFVKNSSASWNVTGVNGIPTGWTVETASE